MSNDPDFIQYVCDQIDSACDVTFRHMFGGTTLYSKGKVVALICDNQLFVKPTDAGRAYIGAVTEAPAYEGSKNFFLIGDEIDGTDWLTELVALTEQALPKPKPRKKKKKKQTTMNPTVLFDVGGVLADLGSPTGSMGLPYGDEEFWQAWTSSPNVRAYETGSMTEDQALPAISHDLGITDLGDFVQIFRRWRLRLYPDVERLVAKLPEDIELALLSNINPIHWQQLSDSTCLFDRFTQLFLSYERGIYKPDAAAFQYVISRLDRDPGDILFLDDTKANVVAARRHGIDAHHVNDFESLESRLSVLLR